AVGRGYRSSDDNRHPIDRLNSLSNTSARSLLNGSAEVVEFGAEYRMHTGEKVRAGATYAYATPEGQQELVYLTLTEPHVASGKFTTDDGEERPTKTTLRRGQDFSLTPA